MLLGRKPKSLSLQQKSGAISGVNETGNTTATVRWTATGTTGTTSVNTTIPLSRPVVAQVC